MSFRIHEAPAPINLHHLIVKPKKDDPIIVEPESAVKPEFTVFVHDSKEEKAEPKENDSTIPDVIKKEEVVMHIRRNKPAK
jgi:hypothetical protein